MRYEAVPVRVEVREHLGWVRVWMRLLGHWQ
jgi:hypothetical protein